MRLQNHSRSFGRQWYLASTVQSPGLAWLLVPDGMRVWGFEPVLARFCSKVPVWRGFWRNIVCEFGVLNIYQAFALAARRMTSADSTDRRNSPACSS